MTIPGKPGREGRNPTRERLIETARELFHAQGYGATGLAQILGQAEVGSGSLYHFFRSKEELLVAVLDRYREMLWPVLLQPVFDRVGDPMARIFELLAAYRSMLLESDFRYGCPIGNLALELDEFQPEAFRLVEANFEAWRRAVRQCLEDAASRFPADTDFDRLATFVLTTMEGGVMQSRTRRDIEPFDQSVAALADYLERLTGAAEAGDDGDGKGES